MATTELGFNLPADSLKISKIAEELRTQSTTADAVLRGQNTKVNSALATAQSVEDRADAGEFVGATGPQGVPGEVSRFKPNTFYAAGAPVLNSLNELVTAKVDFTSSAAYNAANWNPTAATTLLASLDLNGLKDRGLIPDNADMNLYRGSTYRGLYYIPTAANLATLLNMPPGLAAVGGLNVLILSGPAGYGYTTQIVSASQGTYALWWRTMSAAATWNPWTKLDNAATLLPTGADLNTYTGPANSGPKYIDTASRSTSIINRPPNAPNSPANIQILSGHATGYGYTTQIWAACGAVTGLWWRTLSAPNTWNAWQQITSADPYEPTNVGMKNADLLAELQNMHGGTIGLSGRAGCAIRVDHGTVATQQYLVPIMQKHRLHLSQAVYSEQREVSPANNGTPWATVESWHRLHGFSYGNHSNDHKDKPDAAGWYGGTIGSQAALTALMPSVPIRQYMPHGSAEYERYGGFNPSNSHEAIVGTPAGRMALSRHGLIHGYRGGAFRSLAGKPMQGLTHWSMEEASVSSFKGMIDNAILDKAGLAVMFHPEFIGLNGKMTWEQVDECFAYLALKRDAGLIVSLTLDGLAFADSHSTFRSDLVRDPKLSIPAQWFVSGFTKTAGAYTSSTAGSWARTLLDLSRKASVTGGTRTAEWLVSSVNGANVTASVSVVPTTELPDTWETPPEPVSIPAGAVDYPVYLPFGIPLGDIRSLRTQLTLNSGDITIKQAHAYAA